MVVQVQRPFLSNFWTPSRDLLVLLWLGQIRINQVDLSSLIILSQARKHLCITDEYIELIKREENRSIRIERNDRQTKNGFLATIARSEKQSSVLFLISLILNSMLVILYAVALAQNIIDYVNGTDFDLKWAVVSVVLSLVSGSGALISWRELKRDKNLRRQQREEQEQILRENITPNSPPFLPEKAPAARYD